MLSGVHVQVNMSPIVRWTCTTVNLLLEEKNICQNTDWIYLKNESVIKMLLLWCSVAGASAVQKGATPTTSAMVTTAKVQGRDTRMEFGPKATFLTQGNAVLLLFLDTGLGLWGVFFWSFWKNKKVVFAELFNVALPKYCETCYCPDLLVFVWYLILWLPITGLFLALPTPFQSHGAYISYL